MDMSKQLPGPPSDIQAAFDAGERQITRYERSDTHEGVIVHPTTSAVHQLPVRKQARPEFLVADPIFHEPSRFCEYVNDFKDESSRCWYTDDGVFYAVLDYHQTTESVPQPRHGDHVAVLRLKSSPEWRQWQGANQEPMGQQEFAEFIEDHHVDFIEPASEVMTEVATHLQATTSGQFKSARNLGNGSISFAYDEEIQGTVKGGAMDVPKQFQVALRPFMGMPRYPVDCMFRYRINGGSLKLWYKMLSTEAILEAALDQTVEEIAAATGIRPALGNR